MPKKIIYLEDGLVMESYQDLSGNLEKELKGIYKCVKEIRKVFHQDDESHK